MKGSKRPRKGAKRAIPSGGHPQSGGRPPRTPRYTGNFPATPPNRQPNRGSKMGCGAVARHRAEFAERCRTIQAAVISANSARWRVLSRQRILPNYGCGAAPGPLRDFRNSQHQSGSRNPANSVRSSPLSQLDLSKTLPGSMDTGQKRCTMLLELFCESNSAHRCILFARQLGFFKSAKSLPRPRFCELDFGPSKRSERPTAEWPKCNPIRRIGDVATTLPI